MFQATTLGGLAAFAVHGALFPGGDLDGFFDTWVYNGLLVAAALSCLLRGLTLRSERGGWLVLGVGLLAWALGEIHYAVFYADDLEPPYPSLSDVLYLAFYPAAYTALVLVVKARLRAFHASLWLDGVIGALAVAAVGASLLLQPILDSTGGEALTVAADLAYPLGDVVLLALVVGIFALTGWRPGRAWGLIGAGFAAVSVADSLFLWSSATGSQLDGTLLDSLWLAAALLLGWAAWEPPGAPVTPQFDRGRMLVMPAVFALTTLAMLVYDHFAPVNDSALILSTATLVAVIVRTATTFGENLQMLARTREESLTDSLTGLGNRRKLLIDLPVAIDHAGDEEPRMLVLFDLDGFKRYNDTYGHPAGDALLARLGHNLGAAAHPYGTAYRLGGDEFCALVSVRPPGAEKIVAALADALTDHGRGFEVGASHGAVLLPHESGDAPRALQVADQRLYADKGGRRRSSITQQTRDVLLQVLQEREPDLRDHLHGVGELAMALGRRLKLAPEDLDEVARAAELHDVGKMAVPDDILQKPGPLDEVEWALMRQHTVVGQRMLSAAPALLPVAKIVRSTHERWDGMGYPDGLSEDAIPLGARIISVCDAFDAMTSDRPYHAAITSDAAVQELRRCAGTHFDPAVVDAFCAESEAYATDGAPPVDHGDHAPAGHQDEERLAGLALVEEVRRPDRAPGPPALPAPLPR